MSYAEILGALVRGERLGRAAAAAAMGELLDGGWSAAQAGGFLAALALRGEDAEELSGFASALRSRALGLPSERARAAVDTCGTGGSGMATTNTSTAAAFVLAAAGVPVAKHGNRASSGQCGSADVLEELGAAVDLGPEASARLLDEVGIVFLFAPRFHPALRALGPVRRELGVRTVFNLLGPLCNPAGVRRQVLGVSDPRRASAVAGALGRLGCERALVVAGREGLDELSLSGPSRLWDVTPSGVREDEVRPEELGLLPVPFEQVSGGDRRANAAMLRASLGGEAGPRSEHVALNAGAGLVAAGQALTLAEGVARASEILRAGAALGLLDRYVAATRRQQEAA